VAEAAGLLSGILFGLFLLTGSGILYAMARRDQQGAALWRARLMDRIASILPEARVAIRPDGFPALAGRLPDGRRMSAELIADTLVFRRLPQLWLIVTISENMGDSGPSIGGLSRPMGAEFYALVPGLPLLLRLPDGAGSSLLVKGSDDITAAAAERLVDELARLFDDDQALKEILATPRLTRIVRQAAEGQRGAHLLLRQTRFAIDQVAPDLLNRAVRDADRLRAARADPTPSLPGPAFP
jgi:hypothetical protein